MAQLEAFIPAPAKDDGTRSLLARDGREKTQNRKAPEGIEFFNCYPQLRYKERRGPKNRTIW